MLELIGTEVVYPQEKGELQLTLGSRLDGGRGADSFIVPLGVEYGLTDAWQVDIEWGSFRRAGVGSVHDSGIGGISLGTKYSVMNMGGRRSMRPSASRWHSRGGPRAPRSAAS